MRTILTRNRTHTDAYTEIDKRNGYRRIVADLPNKIIEYI